MPKLSADRLPSYCKHKQSGQAVVYLDNREVLLGVHGTAASREKYNRLIGEWLANGRALPAAAADVVILHVIQRFWDHARKYYVRPDGTPSNEQRNFADVLRVLKKSYGRLPAAEFSPLKLKAVREEMIRLGWCRTNINRQIDRLKHVFKWSAENELVLPSVYHGLQAVAGLKAGRSEARESEPVKPVPEAFIDAIQPFVSRQIWGMIQVQSLTGMRPGRGLHHAWLRSGSHGRDLDIPPCRAQEPLPWPSARRVPGAASQQIVSEFLKPDLSSYLFSPADAERERRAKARRPTLPRHPLSKPVVIAQYRPHLGAKTFGLFCSQGSRVHAAHCHTGRQGRASGKAADWFVDKQKDRLGRGGPATAENRHQPKSAKQRRGRPRRRDFDWTKVLYALSWPSKYHYGQPARP